MLEERTGGKVSLTFCPHLLPVRRGILSALYLKTDAPAADLAAALRRSFEGEPFVRVVEGAPPRLSDVVGTNDCRISMRAQRMDGVIDTARSGRIAFHKVISLPATNRFRPTRNRAGWNAMIRGIEL